MRWRNWVCSRSRLKVSPSIPNLHQAIQMVETDEAPDNTVIGELQRGYRIKDRLLRPAMVRVARGK